MKPDKIVILTGDVQSGKSTTLLTWAEQKNVGGFLTLIVSGKRMLFSLPEKEYAPFEAAQASAQTLPVGRYHLLKSAFDQMNHQLIHQSGAMFEWLIIDEVGPLELKGEGIFPGLMYVLHHSVTPLLLVVRTGLVAQVVDKFNLEKVEIISTNSILPLK